MTQILLTDKEINKAMKYAIDWAQDYTIRKGNPDPIPERQVAKAQLKKVVEFLKDSLGNGKTCEACFNETLQALLKEAG